MQAFRDRKTASFEIAGEAGRSQEQDRGWVIPNMHLPRTYESQNGNGLSDW